MRGRLSSPVTYTVYGVNVRSDYDLSSFLPVAERVTPDVEFTCVEGEPPGLPAGQIIYERAPITISRLPGRDLIAFEESTIHVVSDREIRCHLREPAHEFLVSIQLLGMVLALWLESQGRVVLHASAVKTPAGALLFLAGGKAGKTSLAASFAAAGNAVITEDLAALAIGDTIAVQPGYPMMRMWPESAKHFAGGVEGLDTYHPAFEKVWVPVENVGPFESAPVPVRAILIPERSATESVLVDRLPVAEAIKNLLSGSYLADMLEPSPDIAGRFNKVVDLANSTPVFSMIYPEGFEHLADVRRSVLATV